MPETNLIKSLIIFTNWLLAYEVATGTAAFTASGAATTAGAWYAAGATTAGAW